MSVNLLDDELIVLAPLDVEQSKIQVKQVLKDMLGFAEQLVVNSESAYKRMTSLYAQARTWKKAIEEKRKSLTEPYRKKVSEINDSAKKLTDTLDCVINHANAKTMSYQALLVKQKEEEDARLRAAADLFDASDEIYIPPMEKVLRGDGAIAVTKTEKKYRLSDISKVPVKYLMLDEAAIKRDLALGINSIPGLEIYEEQTTKLRIR